jgi:hypothetical protein
MSYSNFNSPQLAQPQQHKFIPAGKFIAIDEKYYQQKEDIHPRANEVFGRQGRPLQPHGTNVNHATPFLPKPQGLSTQDLKVNYLSYIYNQQVGFDQAHPR